MNFFFEKIGKAFLLYAKSPLFYCLLLAPFGISIAYLFEEYTRISYLEEEFLKTCKQAKSALQKREKKQKFLAKYSKASPYFLDENIESMDFLLSEKKEIESMLQHPALVNKKELESRLHFLTNNRLSFTEETIKEQNNIKETKEKQKYPIEADEHDLKKLLSLIENIPIEPFTPLENSPQLVMTEFHLQKKETDLKKDVLEIDMEFIKREFSSENSR